MMENTMSKTQWAQEYLKKHVENYDNYQLYGLSVNVSQDDKNMVAHCVLDKINRDFKLTHPIIDDSPLEQVAKLKKLVVEQVNSIIEEYVNYVLTATAKLCEENITSFYDNSDDGTAEIGELVDVVTKTLAGANWASVDETDTIKFAHPENDNLKMSIYLDSTKSPDIQHVGLETSYITLSPTMSDDEAEHVVRKMKIIL